MKVIILSRQSFFDIAIQTTGSALNALLIAKENNLNPSMDLTPGTVITIPENVVREENVFNYYDQNSVIPTTALNEEVVEIITGCEGIGCWAIGIDFIVS